MSMTKLSVDFKDDIINEEVNPKRKYRVINNDDGTISLEDVTDYLQMGSSFGAKQIIETNQAVNKLIESTRTYTIGELDLEGMKLLRYNVAEDTVQANGFNYAWGEDIPVNKVIDINFIMQVKPKTAYRLLIDASGTSWDSRYNQYGCTYHILDAFPNVRKGALVKEISVYATRAEWDDNHFYIILYNHDHATNAFFLNGWVMLKALVERKI